MLHKLRLNTETKQAWLMHDKLGMPLGNYTLLNIWHKRLISPAVFSIATIEELEIETEFGSIKTKNFEFFDDNFDLSAKNVITKVITI